MLIDDYLTYIRAERALSANTVEAYGRDLRQWAEFATGGRPNELKPDDVTVSDLRTWIASLGRDGCSSLTIRRKLQSLRSFYNYMMRRHGLKSSPAARLTPAKKPRPLPVHVKQAETNRMLDSMATDRDDDDFTATRDRLIMEMLYATGMRCSELVGLRDSAVDNLRCELKVLGKRNKERVVPYGRALAGLIDRYRALRDDLCGPCDDFFVRPTGEPLYRMAVYRIVNRTMSEADVHARRLSPHVMRHSFATDMLNDGADINAVSHLLGHASLATTQIYTHVTFSDLKNNYQHAHPRAIKKGGQHGHSD